MSGLDVTGVSVRFGGDRVLDGVSLSVADGSLHGLIGPNGAGKTTLVNAVTRLVASTGQITVDGEPVRDRRSVARLGVARVFQAPTLCTEMSAIENVMVAGHRRSRSGFVSGLLATPWAQAEARRLRTEAEQHLDRVGFRERPDVDVRELAFGALRQIEIARAVMSHPRLILFDEPTAGMTQAEVTRIGALLRELSRDGSLGMLLIEHNVPFVFDNCDVVTALHQGQVLVSGAPAEVRAHAGLINAYLGSTALGDKAAPEVTPAVDVASVRELTEPAARKAKPGGAALTLRAVTAGYGRADVLRAIDLTVEQGELAAIFGANGAGKTTMFHAIMGMVPRTRGEIFVGDGESLRGLSPDRIVRRGVVLVSQDPHLLYQQTVADNLALAATGARLSRKELARRCDGVYDLFPSLGRLRSAYAAQLSGGERRMLGVGKALIRAPRLLVLDEPSIGLAPATVDAMGAAIASLNRDGLTVLVAEQNARWVLPLADSKYVLDLGTLHRLETTGRQDEDELRLVERYLGAVVAEG